MLPVYVAVPEPHRFQINQEYFPDSLPTNTIYRYRYRFWDIQMVLKK
jgi:hypothetical protein